MNTSRIYLIFNGLVYYSNDSKMGGGSDYFHFVNKQKVENI